MRMDKTRILKRIRRSQPAGLLDPQTILHKPSEKSHEGRARDFHYIACVDTLEKEP